MSDRETPNTEVVEPAVERPRVSPSTGIYLGGDEKLLFEVDTESLPLEATEEVVKIVLNSPEEMAHPQLILDAARDPGSPLHQYFEWDDQKAAEKYRLTQARSLLTRVKVFQHYGDTKVKIRALVSLGSDRITGGGYRPIGAVMSDKDRRHELLSTFEGELRSLHRRYRNMSTALNARLDAVFEEIDTLKGE